MPEDTRRQGPQPSAEPGRKRRIGRGLLIGSGWTALGVAAALPWVLQLLIPDVPPDQRGWLLLDVPTRAGMLWTGVILTIAAFAGPLVAAAWARHRARVSGRARAEQIDKRLTVVNGILSPLVGITSQLASTTDKEIRHKLAGDADRTAVVVLHDLYGGTAGGEARACFYRVRGKAPKRHLEPAVCHGRGKRPRSPIHEDDARGSDTFKALDAGNARRWSTSDLGDPPPGWHATKSYSAFLAYPVLSASGELFGMITVDSPDPGAFRDPADWPTVQLVAELYGAILAMLQNPPAGGESS